MKNEIKITDEQIADGCNEAYLKAGHNAYFGNGFSAGVEFALKIVNGAESEQKALHIDSVMPRFSDDEDEDDIEEQEPDYYTCMCCGNVQEKGMSCNKCAGPTTESFY